jgi:hypothetical protein
VKITLKSTHYNIEICPEEVPDTVLEPLIESIVAAGRSAMILSCNLSAASTARPRAQRINKKSDAEMTTKRPRRHHVGNEAATSAPQMTLSPPRKQRSTQQLAPGYVWNGATQELIPILPGDHPDYAANAETLAAAFRRWEKGENKPE